MPIYEYSCRKCGQVTDVLQKVTDPPPDRCSHCGARGKLTRLVSRTSFVLRGGGWYADLYSSKKPDKTPATKDGKEAKSDATSAESSGSKASQASESTGSKSEASTPAPKPKAEKPKPKKAS